MTRTNREVYQVFWTIGFCMTSSRLHAGAQRAKPTAPVLLRQLLDAPPSQRELGRTTPARSKKGPFLAPQNGYLKLSNFSTSMMPHIFCCWVLAERWLQTSEVSCGLGKVKNLSVFVALAVSSLALEESGTFSSFKPFLYGSWKWLPTSSVFCGFGSVQC